MQKKQNKMRSEIKVKLLVTHPTIPPDQISKILKISPSKIWLRGDKLSITERRYQENGWELSSSLPTSSDIKQHTAALIHKIESHIDKFQDLPKDIEIELSCVVYSYGGDRPAIFFEKEVIRLLGVINAEIDIDLYVL